MELNKIKASWGEKSTRDLHFIQNIIKRLHLKPDAAILDIGTGWGLMAINLALQGYQVTTGEPDDWQKAHAGHNHTPDNDRRRDWKEVAEEFKVAGQIHYQPFNAESLPFPADNFDGIFLYNTLHHISEKTKVLDECSRVLAPSGVLCIFELNEKGRASFHKNHDHDHATVNPGDFIDQERCHLETVIGDITNAYILKSK